MRDQDHGQLKLPEAAEVDEDVGDEHRHGAVGEVDHARAAVLEDESLAEDGVGGARTEAEDQEESVAGHGASFMSRWCTRLGFRPSRGGRNSLRRSWSLAGQAREVALRGHPVG